MMRVAVYRVPTYICKMGIGEILIVLLIILVVFGSNRLPGIARGLGKGIRNFKDATKEERPPDDPARG